ncbi:hypothetical protein RRG08_014249 [Elysia crispata]|uniref:Uncharacterized protein n=1 Tax=Elysia crispata TaxID=231223 RepID=A0AAE0XEF9_9GAST|nr:hypothetical protein RRG08_014249 [Elysia crispata]
MCGRRAGCIYFHATIYFVGIHPLISLCSVSAPARAEIWRGLVGPGREQRYFVLDKVVDETKERRGRHRDRSSQANLNLAKHGTASGRRRQTLK